MAPGEAELKSRYQVPCRIAGAQASATGTAWLAVTAEMMRSDLAREIGMRLGEHNADLRRMFAQRRGLLAIELDVVGGDRNARLAQVFGKDAADFAIADEADFPGSWDQQTSFSSASAVFGEA